MIARVTLSLREGVLDPQGSVIARGLQGLGFEGIGDVRQGKWIEVALPGVTSEDEARTQAEDMCQKLLANPVIESWSIDILQDVS